MICKITVEKYCKDYKHIENYEKAINDNTQTWDCHHRKEIDENKSVQQLIDCGLYYDRPANELIFLTHGEHSKLHKSGEKHHMYGKPSWNKGKHGLQQAWNKGKHGLQQAWNKGMHRVYHSDGTYHMEKNI